MSDQRRSSGLDTSTTSTPIRRDRLFGKSSTNTSCREAALAGLPLIHPSQILRDDFLEPLSLSAAQILSQVVGCEAGSLADPSKHAWANLVAIVKREHEVGIACTR